MFAPIELLAPLAGITLILNIFIAPCIVKVRVQPRPGLWRQRRQNQRVTHTTTATPHPSSLRQGEVVYLVDILSACVQVPGLVLAVVFGPHETPLVDVELVRANYGRPAMIVYVLAVTIAIGIAGILIRLAFRDTSTLTQCSPLGRRLLHKAKPFLYPFLVTCSSHSLPSVCVCVCSHLAAVRCSRRHSSARSNWC